MIGTGMHHHITGQVLVHTAQSSSARHPGWDGPESGYLFDISNRGIVIDRLVKVPWTTHKSLTILEV